MGCTAHCCPAGAILPRGCTLLPCPSRRRRAAAMELAKRWAGTRAETARALRCRSGLTRRSAPATRLRARGHAQSAGSEVQPLARAPIAETAHRASWHGIQPRSPLTDASGPIGCERRRSSSSREETEPSRALTCGTQQQPVGRRTRCILLPIPRAEPWAWRFPGEVGRRMRLANAFLQSLPRHVPHASCALLLTHTRLCSLLFAVLEHSQGKRRRIWAAYAEQRTTAMASRLPTS
ncbi:hypothetical protein FA09DRAFT_264039 [Tilletiopsis washingtonensis]|jgi:hypothetical protein|uniref:Uncharacterized protein n=1 Tax=Tilletiopsis washingtonensis TaxID=58919 RepID=A0A316ZBW9_9BASI|nr:hypothetical protein FA09DRAFT_264039 [Tilletiopsis washingtonensis]PWN98432.1 hypothetical protein FA09DRAFT_264039 [Tilletiopsis washingtonensis]